MDKIIMNQKVCKWNEACRFLKGKQNELSVEEWTAIELLSDFWRKNEFNEDSVVECEELIATLSACDKLHIANLEIVTWSKEFRGIAKTMYTKDKDTFEQFRASMKNFCTNNRFQSISTINSESCSVNNYSQVNNILLKQHLHKWHKAASYLLNVWNELSKNEQNALRVLVNQAKLEWTDKDTVEKCINILAESDKMHTSNKEIIVQSKELRGICRRYFGKDRDMFMFFRESLLDYLILHPLPTVRYEDTYTQTNVDSHNLITSPSIRITGADFANGDVNSNLLSKFGSLLFTSTFYLVPRISYQVLKCEKNKVDIWYKLFDPSGKMMLSQNGRDGYTWHGLVDLSSSGFAVLGGFGDEENVTFATPGTWKIEFFEGDQMLYSTQFYIDLDKNDPSATRSHQAHTQSTKHTGRGCGCLIFILFFACIIWACYHFWYKDYKIDKDASRTYVFADNLNFRSSEVADVESNLIGTISYGSELVTYSENNGWAYVKSDGKKGYVSSDYLLKLEDFQLLNGVWGNSDAKEIISMAKCRLAVLDFLKSCNLKTGDTGWQIFAKSKEVEPNSVVYPNLNDGYDSSADFAFILKDNETNLRKFVLYAFQEDETPVFRYSEDAPKEGDIKSVTYSKRYNRYNVFYTGVKNSVSTYAQPKRQEVKNEIVSKNAELLTVTDVMFANVDYNNNILTPFGGRLYSDLQYLRPKVQWKRSVADAKDFLFQVKVFRPDGMLNRSKTSPSDYTFEQNVRISGTEGFLYLTGWGSSSGNSYIPGRYSYEIWHDGKMLFSTSVNIISRPINVVMEEENKIYDIVEHMPEYPGGMKALSKFLSDNIKYPSTALKNGIQGRVLLNFVVNKDGRITDIKVVKGVDDELDREAVRVVSSMPRWIPGKNNGKPVCVKYAIPIVFKLQ